MALELTLIDNTTQIIFNINKEKILSIPLFKSLLAEGFNENNTNKIKLNVPDCYGIYKIIMSLINSNYESRLNEVVCRNFLGLDFDPSILDNLEIPENGFEMLLDAVNIVGYNEMTVKILHRHIPEKYSILNFSKELLKAIIEFDLCILDKLEILENDFEILLDV